MIELSKDAGAALRSVALASAIAVTSFAVGCGDSGMGGAGGSTSSDATTGTTSGSNTTASSGSGCTGNDENEPNDTFASPGFINDASSGLACGASPISGAGELVDASDVDIFQIYTDSTTCAAPDPKLHVTTTGSIDVCFYIEACGSSIPLLTCPSGTHGEADTDHGIAGCCGTVDASGTIELPGATTCPDFNAKLYVVLQNAAACSDYSFDVSL